MSVEMRDSWSIQPPVEPHPSNSAIRIFEWVNFYGVIGPLIPFKQRAIDGLAFVDGLQGMIDDAPVTKATFSNSDIEAATGNSLETVSSSQTLLRLAGLYRLHDGSMWFTDHWSSNTRWVNPEYVHCAALEPSITEPRYRIEELRRAASLGMFGAPELANRFGSESPETVYSFCKRHEIPLKEWREWGMKRLARTLEIIYAWTEWSRQEIADAVGRPRSTLQHWRDEFTSDFDVPADPSEEPWFPTISRRYESDRR